MSQGKFTTRYSLLDGTAGVEHHLWSPRFDSRLGTRRQSGVLRTRAQKSPLYTALTSGQQDPIRGHPNPGGASLRLDGSENRDLGVTRGRAHPNPHEPHAGLYGNTPPPPVHTEPWGSQEPVAHEQTLRAFAWGEGVTPPARSLRAWPAARPASAFSAPRVLRPPWRGCPTSRRRSGRRVVAQPHRPSGTLGWNRFSLRLEHGAFYCAAASDAQASRVEFRAGGCPASARMPCRGPILR